MSLYDADEVNNKTQKDKKIKRIILISIIILVVMIIAIIVGIVLLVYNSKNQIKYIFNGNSISKSHTEVGQLYSLFEDIEIDDSGEVKLNAPIKEVASFFGYEAYNGGYITVSEDTDSCNVRSSQEVAIFELDSNIITKKDLTVQNSNFENVTIEDKVFKKDGKLYTTKEGLEKAFNIRISYNDQNRTISIFTLDYYLAYFFPEDESKETIIQKAGYKELDKSFVNEKAILDNLLVVAKDTGKYAVIYIQGLENGISNLKEQDVTEILGAQYDSMSYIQKNSSFLVYSNNKYGIISSQRVSLIDLEYDKLELIDNEKQLYLASNDNLYGIVKISGEILINLEYDKIGIDAKEFEENGVTNGYILLDKLIPVCQNEKWGFYDIEGNKINVELKQNDNWKNVQIDSIGCIKKNNQGTTHNLVVIPECNFIIVSQKNGEKDSYGCMDLTGKMVIPFGADEAYIQTVSGKNKYIMKNETITIDVIEKYANENDLK